MFYGKWKHKAQNNANTHLAHAQSIRKQQKRHSRKIQRHCSTIQCNESLNKPKEYLPPPQKSYIQNGRTFQWTMQIAKNNTNVSYRVASSY
jgi:hypothetical protein